MPRGMDHRWACGPLASGPQLKSSRAFASMPHSSPARDGRSSPAPDKGEALETQRALEGRPHRRDAIDNEDARQDVRSVNFLPVPVVAGMVSPPPIIIRPRATLVPPSRIMPWPGATTGVRGHLDALVGHARARARGPCPEHAHRYDTRRHQGDPDFRSVMRVCSLRSSRRAAGSDDVLRHPLRRAHLGLHWMPGCSPSPGLGPARPVSIREASVTIRRVSRPRVPTSWCCALVARRSSTGGVVAPRTAVGQGGPIRSAGARRRGCRCDPPGQILIFNALRPHLR